MKLEELMIGDWVRYNASNGTFFRIEGPKGFDDAKNCKPIPITSEILEANGFKVGMYSTLQLGDGKWLEYYRHEHRLRMWRKGVDEWENNKEAQQLVFQCHVNYIHELQHALRLSKIEKEIKL